MKKHLLALMILSTTLFAQDKVMTPEMLWQLGRVSLDAVSPDGQKFVYGVTRYDIAENKGNRDLFLMSTEGGEAIQLTNLPGSEYGAHFVGDRIAFNHGGQLHTISTNGEDLTAITAIEGGISGAKAMLMPSGSLKIIFAKSFQTQEKPQALYPDLPEANFRVIDDLMYRHWDSWDDYESSHLCLAEYTGEAVREFQDLMEGQPYDVPVPPFGGAESYTMSPDGNFIAYESKRLKGKDFAEQTNSAIYLIDLAAGTEKILSEGLEGYDKNPQISPDGSKIAWLSMRTNGYESDVNDLVVMDLNSGEMRFVLQESELYDQLTFQSFAWAEDDELYAGVPIGGSNHIYEIELEKKKIEVDRITEGDHNYNHFIPLDDALLVDRQDMNHATEVYFVDEDNGKAEALTHVNDELYSQIKMSRIEKRMVITSDQKEMLTWVIYPPNFDPEKSYPTLLYCQGGPQAQVSQFYSFRWNFQLMAAQGYIVVAPNRRGLPGFGREWNEQISKDWGGQSMEDYLAAIDDVAKEPYVDKSRLGAVGASYGGYSVYMLAGIHEGRFSAFISHCGLFDLESWYLTTEEMFFANYDLGGPFWEDKWQEAYRRFDPKDYVQNWDTPILVIHGGLDFRVPENQGMEAFQAAQLRGVPSKFLYFPEESHWVLSPQNGLVWHDQYFGWLDRWLGQ